MRVFILIGFIWLSLFPAAALGFSDDTQLAWSWSRIGEDVGSSMLEAFDFDGDGLKEIVTSDNGAPPISGIKGVHVLSNDFISSRCWFSTTSSMLDGVLWDVSGDEIPEIIIVSSSDVTAYSGTDCSVIESNPFPNPATAAGLGDLDADGNLDVALIIDGVLTIHSWNSSIPKATRRGFPGLRIEIAHIDSVPGEDILVFAQDLTLFSSADLSILSTFSPAPFVATTAQLIPGGNHEIILGERGINGIRAFELQNSTPLWSFPLQNIRALIGEDLDGDQIDEVILGEDGLDGHTVLDANGNQIGQIENPGREVTTFLISDLDNDKSSELLWGTTSIGFLFAAELSTGAIVRQSINSKGALFPAAAGTVASSGRLGAIVIENAQIETGPFTASALSVLVNPYDGSIVQVNQLEQGLGFRETAGVISNDIDGDGVVDLCLNLFDGLTCLDSVTANEIWLTDLGTSPSLLRGMDLDGDTIEEIVIGNLRSISVFDAVTGELRWTNDQLPEIVRAFDLLDNRLWILSFDEQFFSLNPATGELIDSHTAESIQDFVTFGSQLAVAVRNQGIARYDPIAQTVTEFIQTTTQPILGLWRSADLSRLAWSVRMSFTDVPDGTFIQDIGSSEPPLRIRIQESSEMIFQSGGRVTAANRFGVKSFITDRFFVDSFEQN